MLVIVYCHYGPRSHIAKGFKLDLVALRYSGIVTRMPVTGFKLDTVLGATMVVT